jgi:hypothetical protein
MIEKVILSQINKVKSQIIKIVKIGRLREI